MTDEDKKAQENTELEPKAPAEATEEQPAAETKSGGGIMGMVKKYWLFGVIGVLAVALIVVTTLWLAGGSGQEAHSLSTTEQTSHEADSHADATTQHETTPPVQQHGEQSHQTRPQQSESQHSTRQAQHESAPSKPVVKDDHLAFKEDVVPDSMAMEEFAVPDVPEDPQVLDQIMESLEFLDYSPEQELAGDEDSGMSEEDSLEAANWFETENAKLDKRERELSDQQKKLEALDREVSKKLLTLEQAESTRITKLAKLYDGMDARAVVKLLANLDDKTVVSILPRMNIKKASAVLQLMPPARAANLSKRMITIAASEE